MAVTPRALVVSHPAVLRVNQLVYAELVARRWDVELVVPARWHHEYSQEAFEPMPLTSLTERFTALPVALAGRPQRHFYLANPRRVLRSARPEVVFLEQEPFAFAALQWGFAARSLDVPFGVQIDENLDRPLPAPVRAARSWVLRHAAFVAARSPTAAELARRWGASGAVELVPHHVPAWAPRPRPASDRFRIGYAGRLVPEKGLDVLVDAVRRLDAPVELVVAGGGPERGWLEAQDLGTATLRMITGLSHDEMDSAYAEMDVLVLPSRSTPRWTEQFGRTLVEALWCGIPVVGSDSGEIPWVIRSTGGGRVFPEGDASALAGVLEDLRGDEHDRHRLAAFGRKQAEQLFAVDAVASRLGAVLEAAAADAPGARSGPRATPARALASVVRTVPVRGREWLAFTLFERNRAVDAWWTVRIRPATAFGPRRPATAFGPRRPATAFGPRRPATAFGPRRPGLTLRLPAGSRQTWVTAFTGTYAADEVALLASHLRPGTIALDIGASLGLYTVQLAERARHLDAYVVAVEPVPSNAAIVRANLAANGLSDRATVVEVALGAHEGALALLVEQGGAGNATASSGVAGEDMARHVRDGRLGPTVEAPMKCLDALPFERPVSVVKIDAEGFEMDILAGGESFVAEHRPVIFGEFSEPWMRSRGRRLEAPFEWARGHGYSVVKVAVHRSGAIMKRTELRLVPIASPAEREYSELLLVPAIP